MQTPARFSAVSLVAVFGFSACDSSKEPSGQTNPGPPHEVSDSPTRSVPEEISGWHAVGSLVGFDRDGKLIVAQDDMGSLILAIVDPKSGNARLHRPSQGIKFAGKKGNTVRPGSTVIVLKASVWIDGRCRFTAYDYSTSAVLREIEVPSVSATISPDGKVVGGIRMGGDARAAEFYDVDSGKKIGELKVEAEEGILIGPEGKYAVVQSREGFRRRMRIVDIASGMLLEPFEGFRDGYNVEWITPQGTLVLSDYNKMMPTLCIVSPQGETGLGISAGAAEFAISPDGRRFVGITGGYELLVMPDLRVVTLPKRVDIMKQSGYDRICFSPDSKIVFLCDGVWKGIARYDLAAGKLVLPD